MSTVRTKENGELPKTFERKWNDLWSVKWTSFNIYCILYIIYLYMVSFYHWLYTIPTMSKRYPCERKPYLYKPEALQIMAPKPKKIILEPQMRSVYYQCTGKKGLSLNVIWINNPWSAGQNTGIQTIWLIYEMTVILIGWIAYFMFVPHLCSPCLHTGDVRLSALLNTKHASFSTSRHTYTLTEPYVCQVSLLGLSCGKFTVIFCLMAYFNFD